MATRKSKRLAAKSDAGNGEEGAHEAHGRRLDGDNRVIDRRTSIGGAMGLTPARPRGRNLVIAKATSAAEAAAAEQRAAEKEKAMMMAEKREEKRRLMDAASAAGSVFYFDYDSSSLSDDARAAIDAHVALMMADSGNVRLEGHTDERGTREYNLALGERRANAVRDYMVASGVPAYRIETISYGEENPVAYGSGESSWMKNRRVEIK